MGAARPVGEAFTVVASGFALFSCFFACLSYLAFEDGSDRRTDMAGTEGKHHVHGHDRDESSSVSSLSQRNMSSCETRLT